MIRKNTINCKLINIKNIRKSAYDIYDNAISDIILDDEVCPSCGLKGGCSPHASYSRYLIDFVDGIIEYREIEIPRVICECGSTHAILPDPIIPYNQYSLFFVILVLSIYYSHLMTVENLCNKYSITPRMLYRWSSIYSDHRREWQGLLKSTTTDIKKSILELCQKDPYSSFAFFFIQKTSYSFLQTHANPANCKQNLQFGFFLTAYHTT